MKEKVIEKAEKRSTEIIALTLILGIAGVAAQSGNGPILSAGSSSDLVAEYRFDTGTGNTVYDSAGGNDGDINGAGWSEGVSGKAMDFSQNGDQVTVPDDPSLEGQTEGITVSFWFYSRQDNVGDWSIAMSKGAFANDPYAMIMDSVTGDKFRFDPTLGDQSGNYYRANIDNIPHRRWTHLVMRYDPQTGDMTVFRDGKLGDTTSVGDIDLASNSKNLQFGEGGSGGYIDGKIDQARIYSNPLSDSEIKTLYNRGSWRIGSEGKDSESNIMDLSFQHQNSTHVLDTSGQENHGRKQNGISQKTMVNCQIGRCASFDGAGGTGIDLDTVWSDHSVSRTFMFWFKEGEGVSAGDRIITQDCNEWFCLRNEGEDSYSLYYDGGNSYQFNMDDSEWHHTSLVFNSSASEIELYTDGQLEQNFSYNSGWSHNARPVVLGGNTEGTDDITSNHWEGRIDEFKVFNQPLTQEEVIQQAENIESRGAVLDMRFNRNGGDKAYDHSGEGNTGIFQPDETVGPQRVDGVIGKALEFDGFDDRVEPGLDSVGDKPARLTVSAWYKTEGNYNDDSLVSDEITAPDEGFGLRPDSFRVGRGNGNGYVEASGSLISGGWTHVVGTYDNSTVKFYQDGELLDQTSFAGPYFKSSRQLVVGYNAWRNSGTFDQDYGWKGEIDEVKIYPYAASNAQVKQLYRKGESNIGSSTESASTGLQEGLVLDQSFDRVETCGNSDTVSCPSGTDGKVAVDESGEANHGELVNGPEVKGSENCKSGKCLGFDGSDDSLDIPNDEVLNFTNSDNFTYSTWIKREDATSGVMIKGHTTYSSGFDLYAGDIRFGARDGSGTGLVVQTSIDKKWHHVVGVFNAPAKEAKLYVDGRLADTDSKADLNDFSTTRGLKLGGSYRISGASTFGKVSLDQAKIHDRALSETEVWNLYTNGRDRKDGSAGPTAKWSFDSVYGNKTYDSAGDNDGTVYGANLTAGKRGSALEFDGNDDYVSIDGIEQFDNNNKLSISAWVKRKGPADRADILNAGTYDTLLFADGGNAQGSMYIHDGSDSHIVRGYTIPQNEWHHLTGTYDGSTLKIYQNGVLQDSKSVSVSVRDSGSSTRISDSGSLPFEGKIDDVRIYPYALSDGGVKNVMNSGSAGVSSSRQRYDVPRDCQEIKERQDSTHSGVFRIDPDGSGGYSPFEVYCEMGENGGGWTRLYTTKDGAVSGDKGWAFGENSFMWESGSEVNFGNGQGWVSNTGNNETWSIGKAFMSSYEGKTAVWDYYSANGNPIHPAQIQALSDTTEDGTYYVGDWYTDDIDEPITDVFAVAHPSDYDCVYGGCMTIFPSSDPSPSVGGDYVLGSNHGSGGTWTDYIDWRSLDDGDIPTHLGFRDGNGRIAHWGEGDFTPDGGHTLEFENPYFYAR
ncbi:LamG-like jellyroll fold domain-containing protein [Candidatus Nanohalococcus occultus]|uniref:LamG domain-containing protein n=1 Tax=Candidatus Nanohalococcus occultus TaxID=2978047 RepID=A0ABY8CIU7_9ARCH|nr:LamG domain-containing protein [Candidatus Nanohaloarchaeota archaeon SVXNc]